MSLQLATFKTRAITAILFVAAMASGLFLNSWTYLILFLCILSASWLEFKALIDRINGISSHIYLTLGWVLSGIALSLLWSGERYRLGPYLLKDVLVFPFQLAGFIFLVWGTFAGRVVSLRNWLSIAAGNLYLTLPLVLAIHLYGFGPSPEEDILFFDPALWWIVIAILTMWVNDTLAYLFGSLFGRTPFSKISPKKTWEGTMGGILSATALIGWLLDCYINNDLLSPIAGYVLIFLLAVAGTIGDLFESKLKRMAGVKDSGQLMPGHGGMLDRFDSLLFALPVLYLFLRGISLIVD